MAETLPSLAEPPRPLPFEGSSPAGAPIISEWNRFLVLPDESFTLTGTLFTAESGELAASDTIVWIWADTSDGGRMGQCQIWSVTNDNILMAAVPKDFPVGPYIVWVQNKNGVSSPILLNQCEALWLGPLGDSVPSGEASSKRVFGRNLQPATADAAPSVFLGMPDGSTRALKVLSSNPYAIEFEVPADLTAGSYTIRVHNGKHSALGWSRSLPLEAKPRWVRGDFEVVLKADTEEDRTDDLQDAIDQVAARPNGGTVRLEEGTFRISSKVTMKSRVRLQGAGPEKTTILGTGGPRSFTTGDKIMVRVPSQHIAFEDLTIRAGEGTTFFGVGSDEASPGSFAEDVLIRNVHFRLSEDATSSLDCRITGRRVEITQSIFEGKIFGSTSDFWIHRNHFFGSRLETSDNGAMEFKATEKEDNAGRLIIENCLAETRNWPKSESGSRNYPDFLTKEERKALVLCSRLVHFALHRGSFQFSYIANNKTKDVGIDVNKGENILFHSSSSNQYARVLSNTGRTLTIDPAGVIRGETDFSTERGTENDIRPMTAVREKLMFGKLVEGGCVVIVDGKGVGQFRAVESFTKESITVKEPWAVEPDETSIIVVTYLYKDHVVYNNDLNGMPEGWQETKHTGSTSIQFDANIFRCIADNNTNTRTYYGDVLMAHATAPSFWNEFRNSVSKENFKGGLAMNVCGVGNAWTRTPNLRTPGLLLLGNYIRGGETDTEAAFKDAVRLHGAYPPQGNHMAEANGIENVSVKRQILTSSYAGSQLLRRNRGIGSEAAIVINDFADPLLIENSGFTVTGAIFKGGNRNAIDPAPHWGGRILAGSTQDGSHTGRSTDDNLDTEWVAAAAEPGWLLADLGSAFPVSEVELLWSAPNAKTIKVDVSADATNWETVLDEESRGESIIAPIGNKPLRYVRVSFDNRSIWPKLREFRIMGLKPGASEPTNLLLLPPWSAPLPVYPCVFVRGSGEISVPIANPGVADLHWKVTSVSARWIQASASNTNVPSQQTNGSLAIQIKADGLPDGLHRGVIQIEDSYGSVRSIGVVLDTRR